MTMIFTVQEICLGYSFNLALIDYSVQVFYLKPVCYFKSLKSITSLEVISLYTVLTHKDIWKDI